MTTKWISQIFSGGTPQVAPPTVANPPSVAANAIPPVAAVPSDTSSEPPKKLSNLSQADLNKFVVILLYGKNSFGDKIYSYLKISLGGIEKLKAALLVGMPFNPTDFGSIIAAGKGEPSDEVRAEISSMYYVLTAQTEPAQKATAVTQKKSWDEY